MEIKTNDQLLDELKCVRYRSYIKECMQAAAAQAVKLALEEAGDLAQKLQLNDKPVLWRDINSGSLEKTILDKLK